MAAPGRSVLVPYERMPGWTERFAARHGDLVQERDGADMVLTAADGAVATYDDAPPPETFGLVLVRRGGYAVGLVRGATLVAHKNGTRYVQGQTKAGGWSQQRYARRRANQADELVRSCVSHVDRILGDRVELPVFGGGDRTLVEAVLAQARTALALQSRWLDVPDPRQQILLEAVSRARSYDVRLNALA